MQKSLPFIALTPPQMKVAAEVPEFLDSFGVTKNLLPSEYLQNTNIYEFRDMTSII